MTIASEVNRSGPYECNGATTSFSFGFKVYDQRHVRVILTDAVGVDKVLALGTEYVVFGVGGDGGGSVVTTATYASGNKLTVLLSVPFTQDVALENQGAYFAEVIERAFDESVQRVLQLREELSRAYKAPPSVSTGLTIEPSAFEEVLGNAAAVAAYKDEAAMSAATATHQVDLAKDQVALAALKASAAVSSAAEAKDWAAQAALFGGLAYRLFVFTAGAGQTVFSLGETINVSTADVHINGVQLPTGGDDYTLTSTTLTLAAGAAAGAKIEVRVFTSFAVANALIPGNNLADLPNKSAARVNLGLGTAAQNNAGTGPNMIPYIDAAGKFAAISSLPSGSVIGHAYAEYTSTAAHTSIIPLDNTKPQITEGEQILALTILPKVPGSKIRLRFKGQVQTTANTWPVVAAFLNGGADAIDSYTVYVASGESGTLVLESEFSPSGLTTQTVTIRVGAGIAATLYLNSYNNTTVFGGTMRSTLILEEIAS